MSLDSWTKNNHLFRRRKSGDIKLSTTQLKTTCRTCTWEQTGMAWTSCLFFPGHFLFLFQLSSRRTNTMGKRGGWDTLTRTHHKMLINSLFTLQKNKISSSPSVTWPSSYPRPTLQLYTSLQVHITFVSPRTCGTKVIARFVVLWPLQWQVVHRLRSGITDQSPTKAWYWSSPVDLDNVMVVIVLPVGWRVRDCSLSFAKLFSLSFYFSLSFFYSSFFPFSLCLFFFPCCCLRASAAFFEEMSEYRQRHRARIERLCPGRRSVNIKAVFYSVLASTVTAAHYPALMPAWYPRRDQLTGGKSATS